MGQKYFIAIETFKTFRKKVGDSDTEITDASWKNFSKKWLVPIESGDTKFDPTSQNWVSDFTLDDAYVFSLTCHHRQTVRVKPYVLTSEQGKVVAYTLNYKIDTAEIGKTANPDLTNDGNDKITRLDGGLLSDEDVCLSWTITDFAGVVLKPDHTDLLRTPPLFNYDGTPFTPPLQPDKYPAPFIFFRRNDMA